MILGDNDWWLSLLFVFFYLERMFGSFVVLECPAIRSYPLVAQIREFALQGDTTAIGAIWDGKGLLSISNHL